MVNKLLGSNEIDSSNKLDDLYSLNETQLFNLIQATNISEIVQTRTVYWKNRLSSIIQKNPKVKEALFYIIENYTKKRKNNPDKLGYMHCMEAAALVAEYWFDEADVVAAALLHDVWEDIPNGENYLKSTYNENIVNLVKALTEKDKTWDTVEQQKASREERKIEELEKASQFSPKVLALKLWDQLSNIAETVCDLGKLSREDRQKYWEWFNAGYDKQIWKYKTLSDIIWKRIEECKQENLFENEVQETELRNFWSEFDRLVNMLWELME